MTEQKHGVSKLTIILVVVIAILLLGYLAIDLSGSGSSGESRSSAKTHEVIYLVDGVGTALLTYENADGEMGQEENADLPWATDFERKGNQFAYISAAGSGRLECTILIDGKLLEEKTGNEEVKCEGRTE